MAMNRQLAVDIEEDVFSEQCQALSMTLAALDPIIKQMHILASNTTCCASKMGCEGDVLRVVAKDIQRLGVEVVASIDEASLLSNDLMALVSGTAKADTLQRYQVITLLRQLDLALSPISTTARKGEYLAVYSSLEAVHLSEEGRYIETMASKLKVLMTQLNAHYKQQNVMLQNMAQSRPLGLI